MAVHTHPTAPTRPALGQQASFWVSAGVVTHIFWTSAAPAMTYRLYAEQWHLTPTVTTAIFAVYPIVVVAILIGFGDLSDQIGRRAAILLGLGASLIGTLLFAVAPDVPWLFAGRAFAGIGVGLTAGSSTAALVDFSAEGQPTRAASVTTAAQAFGFTAALFGGGALTQYAPWPTRLGFWLLSGLIALLFVATWFLPRRLDGTGESRRWRPKSPSIPAGLRPTFAVTTSAVTTKSAERTSRSSAGRSRKRGWSFSRMPGGRTRRKLGSTSSSENPSDVKVSSKSCFLNRFV